MQKLPTSKFHGDDPSSAFSQKNNTSQPRRDTAASLYFNAANVSGGFMSGYTRSEQMLSLCS
jgi:hypothetical protein